MNRDGGVRPAFLHSPALEAYAYPEPSPFRTERAAMTRRILETMGLLRPEDEVVPDPAPRDLIETFHAPRYLDVMIEAARGRMGVEGLEMGLGTEECPVFAGMYEYAALACGATVEGARLILGGSRRIAFNPSGGYHHAGPEYASGFCYVNDVAIACLMLARSVDRVLFLDIDVHHGDGVQNAFYDRRDVCTVSIHETGRTLFPGTGFEDEIGVGVGRGYSINVPLPPGTYDEAYLRAFRAIVPPILAAYDPQAIVLEIGMDALAGDPLAHLNLTNNAYADAVALVLAADKPVLVTGGGGYHPRNTARGWALIWTLLCGETDPSDAAQGLGGIFLESTEWYGGLRDRTVPANALERGQVDAAVDATIRRIQELVFPLHGL